MATINLTPGLNKISAAFGDAGTPSGAHDFVFAPGIYTFSGGPAIELSTAAWGGKNFSGSRFICNGNIGDVTLDMSGTSGNAINRRGIDSITLEGFKIICAVSGAGDIVASDATSSDGWKFRHLILAGNATVRNRTFFRVLAGQLPGLSNEFDDIVLDATYAGARVISIIGPASDIDLLIKNLDARLHATAAGQGSLPPGTLEDCCTIAVTLEDVRDARVLDLKADDFLTYGAELRTVDEAKGSRDVRFARGKFNRIGSMGIHAGHTTDKQGYPWPVAEAYNISYEDCECRDTIDGYGFEFENGVHKSQMVGCKVYNPTRYAYPLAEDTYECRVEGCLAIAGPGTSPTDGTGVVFSNGRKHIVRGNTFVGLRQAVIIQKGAGTYDGTGGGGYFIPTERCTFQDNLITGCGYVYNVGAAAMPAGALAHMLGRNLVAGLTVGYARVDAVTRTQAEFTALYPDHIDEPDMVVSSVGDVDFVSPATEDYRTYDSSPAEALRAGFYRSSQAIPPLVAPTTLDPGAVDLVLVLPNTRGGEKFFADFAPFEGDTPRPTRIELRDKYGVLDTSIAVAVLSGKLRIDGAAEVAVPILNNWDGTFDILWPDPSVFEVTEGKRKAKASFDTHAAVGSNSYYLKRFAFMVMKRV